MKPIKHIKTGESGDGIKFVKSGENKLLNMEEITKLGVQQIPLQLEKHIKEIKEQGYTILPQVLKPIEVSYYFNKIKKIYEETKDKIAQDTPMLNYNQPNIYNLQNKGKEFIDLLLGNSDIEKILIEFLNDKWYKSIPQNFPNFILRAYGARSSNTALPLHIDSFIPYVGEEVIAMQVAIMLEDSRIENGCTTVVPGSHQSGRYADNDFQDTTFLECKAGDILIWDSRLWHGTTENKTKRTRWAIIATFTRWWVKQMFDIPGDLHYDIWKELTQKERYILGFGTRPYKNEFEGIEMKKGYNEL